MDKKEIIIAAQKSIIYSAVSQYLQAEKVLNALGSEPDTTSFLFIDQKDERRLLNLLPTINKSAGEAMQILKEACKTVDVK